MKIHTIGLLLFMSLLVAACANPKTPAEFRSVLQAHANLSATHIEKFEVSMSMHKTAQFVARRASECLNITENIKERVDYGAIAHRTVVYEPFSTIADDKAEIYLKQTHSSGDKIIMFVADYYPVTKSKTRVEFYYTWGGDRARIAKAFRLWSQGKRAGCPDLS